ncbi:hypothetical protein JW756_03890 [Candidatus Woesearchaeota archaeon]|nr:hypothetical protein [Candidatus Woesearchaeota archaeon]
MAFPEENEVYVILGHPSIFAYINHPGLSGLGGEFEYRFAYRGKKDEIVEVGIPTWMAYSKEDLSQLVQSETSTFSLPPPKDKKKPNSVYEEAWIRLDEMLSKMNL